MGIHLSKDDATRFTSATEVRGPSIRMTRPSQRRVSYRIAKQGIANASIYSRDAYDKPLHLMQGVDDDTVSTHSSPVVSITVIEKRSSSDLNHTSGIVGWFKRQPFASDDNLRNPSSTLRQDSSGRDVLPRAVADDASSPLPIPACKRPTTNVKSTAVDEDGEYENLRRVYDMRTWDMYMRITESRRHSSYQSQAPANSYAGGSTITSDYCLDSDVRFHGANDCDEELIFYLE